MILRIKSKLHNLLYKTSYNLHPVYISALLSLLFIHAKILVLSPTLIMMFPIYECVPSASDVPSPLLASLTPIYPLKTHPRWHHLPNLVLKVTWLQRLKFSFLAVLQDYISIFLLWYEHLT